MWNLVHYTLMKGSVWIIHTLHSWLRMGPQSRITKKIKLRKSILNFHWNTLKAEAFDSRLPCIPWHLSGLDAKWDHSACSFYMGIGGYSRWKQWRLKPTEPIMQTVRFTKPRTGRAEVTAVFSFLLVETLTIPGWKNIVILSDVFMRTQQWPL